MSQGHLGSCVSQGLVSVLSMSIMKFLASLNRCSLLGTSGATRRQVCLRIQLQSWLFLSGYESRSRDSDKRKIQEIEGIPSQHKKLTTPHVIARMTSRMCLHLIWRCGGKGIQCASTLWRLPHIYIYILYNLLALLALTLTMLFCLSRWHVDGEHVISSQV